MKRGASALCRRVRRDLQRLHDAGGEPRGETAEHIAGCPGCASFRVFLSGLGAEMKMRESEARLLPAPDPAAVARGATSRASFRELLRDGFRRVLSPRHPRLLIAAAGCIPVLCAAFVAVLILGRAARTRADVDLFVGGLYETPFLEGIEVASGGEEAGLEEWLSDVAQGTGSFEPALTPPDWQEFSDTAR